MTECFGIADIGCGRWTGAEESGDGKRRQNEGYELQGVFHDAKTAKSKREKSRMERLKAGRLSGSLSAP